MGSSETVRERGAGAPRGSRSGRSSTGRARRRVDAGLALLLTFSVIGCSEGPPAPPDEPPEIPPGPRQTPSGRMPYGDLDTLFPERLGPYERSGVTERNHAEVNQVHIPSARQQYLDGEREVVIEVFDARMAAVLAQGFYAARMLESDTLDELVRAERVAGQDALLTWTRADAESAVQVMLPGGVLAQLRVWPADRRDHALQLLAAVDLEGLGRRLHR
ncbi:MAG: hypothetical protein R3B40_11535 [Polyangiales bacterium]